MAVWLWVSVAVLLLAPLWVLAYALCKAAAEPPHAWGHLTRTPGELDAERRRRARE